MQSIGPIWQKLVKARTAEIEEGLALGASLDKMAAKYLKAQAKREDAERAVESLKNSVGFRIFQRLRDSLVKDAPYPMVEDTIPNRVAWKRATRLKALIQANLEQGALM